MPYSAYGIKRHSGVIHRAAPLFPPAAAEDYATMALFYGYPGRRLVGYDNESGEGDHRHWVEEESRYRFTTVDQLIDDFLADVRRARKRT